MQDPQISAELAYTQFLQKYPDCVTHSGDVKFAFICGFMFGQQEMMDTVEKDLILGPMLAADGRDC